MASPFHPQLHTLFQPRLEGLGAGGWAERAGASLYGEERETEGLGSAPRRAGGWVPRMKAGVGEPERVEGTRASKAV